MKPTKAVRILGIDPGKKNMGISIVEVRNGKPKVLDNSLVINPVSVLNKDFRGVAETFLKEIDEWIKQYKPSAICMERFMTRGTMGTTIECVGVMIGLITARYDLPIKLLSAATWKNEITRRITSHTNIELGSYYKIAGVTPHALDSILIGIYGLEIGLRKKFNYTLPDIINQADKTSRVDISKRKLTLHDLELASKAKPAKDKTKRKSKAKLKKKR